MTAKTNLPRVNRLVMIGLALPLGLVATLAWGALDPRAGGSDLAMVWAAFMAVLSVGPLLKLSYGRFWPGLAQATVVLTATALSAGSVATVRFGWEPPAPLYRSFRPDIALAGARVETNELGTTVIVGPAVGGRPADVAPGSGQPAIPGAPGAPSSPAAGVAKRTSLAPANGIYVGFTSDALPYNLGDADRWAGHVAEPQIVHWYQQWGSGDSRFRGDWVAAVAASGRIPMISWEAWAKPEGKFTSSKQALGKMADIADGTYDDYIDSWAVAAAAHGGPILLRPFHEMNGYWYPWSVGQNGNTYASYIAGWRHVVDRFRSAGATNVSFVWSINTLASFDTGKGVEQAYPGDDYVDWVGTSGFNWDDYAPAWSSWVTPQWVFGDTYRLLDTFHKPVMFAEIGTGTHGGDAAAWVGDAMSWFATLSHLGAVLWFDRSYDAKIDFRLGSAQQAALRRAVTTSGGHFDPALAVVSHPVIDPGAIAPLAAIGSGGPAAKSARSGRVGGASGSTG